MQKAGEGMDADGVGANGRRLDAQPPQKGLDLFEDRHLPRRGRKGRWNQKTLALQRPLRQAGEQILVHDPLVQGVLVDDDQSVLGFGHEVAVVKLQRRNDGA